MIPLFPWSMDYYLNSTADRMAPAQILCSHRASVDTAIATENHNWVFRSNPRRLLMLSPNSDKMTDSPGGNSVMSCRSTKLWYTRKSEASHVLEGCPAVPFS